MAAPASARRGCSHAAHPRRAIGTAADSGQPNLTQTVKHNTAPSIIMLPWARLTVLDTIGDVEAERQQPVHAAKAETGNDYRGNEHRLHTSRCSPARSRGPPTQISSLEQPYRPHSAP